MKIFFDTEFFEDGKTIDLISIGMVREDGSELYLESSEADLETAGSDPWMKENVLKHLTGITHTRNEIKNKIIEFCGENPVFYGYFSSYDWVVLCQLFGRMIDLPKNWPMFPIDLKQQMWMINEKNKPVQDGTEHNALQDAIWNKKLYEYLQNRYEIITGKFISHIEIVDGKTIESKVRI